MSNKGSPAARRKVAKESFSCAAETIGSCEAGMSLFAITRGQWSMIDAILHVLDQVGPAAVSCWTWTIADYEVEVLRRMQMDARITAGLLVIDHGARDKNSHSIASWQEKYGPASVRYVINHAKIATVASASGLRFLLRGSMNLNLNPRFEQFDITEGGEDFDLVHGIEEGLPALADSCSGAEVWEASGMKDSFNASQRTLFSAGRVWAPNGRRPK